MPFRIGPMELIIILVVVLIIFGPSKLPEIGKSLGKSITEFKRSINSDEDDHPSQKRNREAARNEDVLSKPKDRADVNEHDKTE